MKVIDTTLFSQDFNTLEIRFHELWDVVDLFLVCESNFSFAGRPKQLYLETSRGFKAKYESKLLLVPYVIRSPHKNPWMNEMLQRQHLTRQIRKLGLKDSDLILHSDCDEIPKASIVSKYVGRKANVLLEFRNYTYYLNLRNGFYARGRIINRKDFISIQHLRRDIYLHNLNSQRDIWFPIIRTPEFWITRSRFLRLPEVVWRPPRLTFERDAGWHFNNLLSPEEILNKINWSAHQELNTETVANLQHIETSRLNHKELYKGAEFTVENIDSSYPEYVLDNMDKFANLIAPK